MPGPPPVSANGMSNSFRASARRSSSTMMIVGCRTGSRTLRAACRRPTAPSMRAASIQLVRNALERGQEDEEAERRPLPDVDDDDRDQRPVRVGEERDAGPAERAALLVEDGEEAVAHRDRRGEDRQDHDGPQERAPGNLARLKSRARRSPRSICTDTPTATKIAVT